jgi:hypothetical protein
MVELYAITRGGLVDHMDHGILTLVQPVTGKGKWRAVTCFQTEQGSQPLSAGRAHVSVHAQVIELPTGGGETLGANHGFTFRVLMSAMITIFGQLKNWQMAN